MSRWGSKQRLYLVTGIIGLLIVLMAVGQLRRSHQQHLNRIGAASLNLARTLELSLAGALDAGALVIASAVNETERELRDGALDERELQRFLDGNSRLVPGLETHAVADATGRIIAGSDLPRYAGQVISIAHRGYFQSLRGDPTAGTIFAGPIQSGATGNQVLVLAKRVNAPDGSFAGAVVGAIPITWFKAMLEPIDVGRHGLITLRDGGFANILAVPQQSAMEPGERRLSQPTLDNLREHPASSTYRTTRRSDGSDCTISYRRLERYPLYLAVAFDDRDHLSDWWNEVAILGLLTTGFLVFLVIAVRFLLLSTERELQTQRQAESQLRQALELMPVPIGISTTDRIHLVNRQFTGCFGFGIEDLPTIDAWLEKAYPDPTYRAEVTSRWDNDVAGAMQQGVSTPPREYRITCKDGTIKHAIVRARPIGSSLLVVFQDLTERLRAEAAIHAGEARFRQLFDLSRDGFTIVDLQGRFVEANAAYCELTGYSLDELRAKDSFFNITPERWHAWEKSEIFDKLLACGKHTGVFEKEYIRKDGIVIPVEVSAFPVCASDGRASYYWGLVRDISERKRNEAELARHRDHLEELVRQRSQELDLERERFEQYFTLSRVLTVALDLHGRIARINPYGAELLGWSVAELNGKDWFTTCLPREEGTAVHEYFIKHITSAPNLGAESFASETFENSLVKRNGRHLRMLFRNAWLRDAMGRVTGTISSAIDITTLREAETELNRAKEAAERANRAKSDFLASMSHEIRTPLNAVLGYAQVLARDPEITAAQRQAVQVINRSGEHLLQLINDILEMSRIEAGRNACDPEDFDLPLMLDNLRSLFLQRAVDKGLALAVSADPGLPRFIRADQRKLRQILINLLSNAVKFTRQGRVGLEITWRDGHLLCAVSDSGPGLSALEIAELGQPFVQAEAGRKRGDGTGLGLAISFGFARLMGGSLTVASTPGSGSVFTLRLPVSLAVAAVRQPPRMQAIGLVPGQRAPRLLVAEDHPDSRELLTTLLSSAGCEVEAVGDGIAAVETCRRSRPDLVWMDIDMPLMDGLRAAAAIRALPGTPPVIVALSAAAFAEDRQRFLAGGCDDVASKPFNEETLFRLMERLLRVDFVWRDIETPATDIRIPDDAELHRLVATIRHDDAQRLATMVVTGDVDAAQRLIDTMADQEVATHLRTLLATYQFDRLQALLDRAQVMP